MNDETRLSRAAVFLDQRLTGAEAGIAISIMKDFAEAELERIRKKLIIAEQNDNEFAARILHDEFGETK